MLHSVQIRLCVEYIVINIVFIKFNVIMGVLGQSQTNPPAKIRKTQCAGNQYVSCR